MAWLFRRPCTLLLGLALHLAVATRYRRFKAERTNSTVAEEAGLSRESSPLCSCDCCVVAQRTQSDILALSNSLGAGIAPCRYKCSSAPAPLPSFCGSPCRIPEGREDMIVLESSVNADVMLSRFCFQQCLPKERAQANSISGVCSALSEDEVSRLRSASGNGLDPAHLYSSAASGTASTTAERAEAERSASDTTNVVSEEELRRSESPGSQPADPLLPFAARMAQAGAAEARAATAAAKARVWVTKMARANAKAEQHLRQTKLALQVLRGEDAKAGMFEITAKTWADRAATAANQMSAIAQTTSAAKAAALVEAEEEKVREASALLRSMEKRFETPITGNSAAAARAAAPYVAAAAQASAVHDMYAAGARGEAAKAQQMQDTALDMGVLSQHVSASGNTEEALKIQSRAGDLLDEAAAAQAHAEELHATAAAAGTSVSATLGAGNFAAARADYFAAKDGVVPPPPSRVKK